MILDYELIKKMSVDAGLSNGKLSEEYMFTLYVVNLFLYETNMGVSDIQDGFTDGNDDGGIDFIYSDNDSVTLVQGKSTENISYEEVINVYDKIIRTINLFKEQKYDSFSQKLKSTYINTFDSTSENPNINIVLYTRSNVSEDIREKIEEILEGDKYSNYNCILYDINDIEKKQTELQMGEQYVPEAKLIMCEPKNYLIFKKEKEGEINGYIKT